MLDEADVIPDLDVLEDLFAVDGISVIAIAHQQVKWLNRVDRDLRPHFHGDSQIDSQIEFRKYGVDELVDILEPRVEHGLTGDPTQDDHLEWIADETGGVARWAIKSVLSAAELALKREVTGNVDPARLSSLERDLLKDALSAVKRFKAVLHHRLRLDVV